MKLEIEYDGKVVGSLSTGETAIVPKELKFKTDLTIKAVVELVKLKTPNIRFSTISPYPLLITDTSGKAELFNIYCDGNYLTSTDKTNIDLSEFFTASGTYNITVIAIADGYEESEHSNTVEYTKTDLSGTSWYVPAGWQCPAAYDYSEITGTFDGDTMTGFWIGWYSFYGNINVEEANCVAHRLGGRNTIMDEHRSYNSFTIVIKDGRKTTKKTAEWLRKYGILQS